MAPKRSRRSIAVAAENPALIPGKPYLDRLPAELIDRICEFVPNRDTLLSFRATCRDLATKTSEPFGKAYWTQRFWLLSRSGWKNFRRLAEKHPNINSYIRTITLVAPDSHCRQYDNYLLAKGWGTGQALAKSASKLTNLRVLNMHGFKFANSRAFLDNFCPNMKLSSLAHLSLDELIVQDTALGVLIRNHAKTLHDVRLDIVDLYGGSNEFSRDMSGDSDSGEDVESFCTPWSTVFEALIEIQQECSIQIDKPMQFGHEVDILGNQSFLYDFDFNGYEQFWGTTVQMVPDLDPMDDPYMDNLDSDEMHLLITVNRDKHWKKGLQRLQSMYEYPILDPDRDGTPPWEYDQEESSIEEFARRMMEARAGESFPSSFPGQITTGITTLPPFSSSAAPVHMPDGLDDEQPEESTADEESETLELTTSSKKGKGKGKGKAKTTERKPTATTSNTKSKGKGKVESAPKVGPSKSGKTSEDPAGRYSLRRSSRNK